MNRLIKLFGSLAALVALSACAPNYSDGDRVGVVTKLSYKGLVFKSWEGTLNQGGTTTVTDSNGHSSVVPNAINFNASDPVVIQKLKDAATSGKRVKLVYHQWFIAPLTIENDHVIVDVTPVD